MMENIESRMLQTTITKGNNKECEVRQELYRKHQIRKKAQQDVGLFYCSQSEMYAEFLRKITTYNLFFRNRTHH